MAIRSGDGHNKQLPDPHTVQVGPTVAPADASRTVTTLPEKNDQARLKALSSQHASDWLHALPICGLRLSDEATRVAVGIRLGANLCQPHTCACGAAKGTHGLSCALGFGRTARHASINDLIHRSLIKPGYQGASGHAAIRWQETGRHHAHPMESGLTPRMG